MAIKQSKFSELLARLLERSKEGNRCWAKVNRMRDNDPYRENYIRSGQDADEARTNIRSLLLNGKYIAESKSEELVAIEEISKRTESYSWELDFTPSDDRKNYVAKEKRELLEHLELLKKQIESGEQINIEKAGQEELNREEKNRNQKHLDEFETLSNECFKKIFELGLKTNDNLEELSVTDYKEIKSLIKKLNKAEKNKSLDDPLIKQEIKSLQSQLQELEGCASPQTQDKASSDKSRNRKANKTCRHENIEPYEDDPNNYCCSYCWDSESEAFLKVLARKGIKQGEKNPNSPNNNPPIEQKKEQLQQAITNLTNKPNKTPREEAELADKQAQLAQLTKPINNEPTNNNSWLTPPLLIGDGIIVVLIIWLIVNYNNRKK